VLDPHRSYIICGPGSSGGNESSITGPYILVVKCSVLLSYKVLLAIKKNGLQKAVVETTDRYEVHCVI
jgi:hypothetical protein